MQENNVMPDRLNLFQRIRYSIFPARFKDQSIASVIETFSTVWFFTFARAKQLSLSKERRQINEQNSFSWSRTHHLMSRISAFGVIGIWR